MLSLLKQFRSSGNFKNLQQHVQNFMEILVVTKQSTKYIIPSNIIILISQTQILHIPQELYKLVYERTSTYVSGKKRFLILCMMARLECIYYASFLRTFIISNNIIRTETNPRSDYIIFKFQISLKINPVSLGSDKRLKISCCFKKQWNKFLNFQKNSNLKHIMRRNRKMYYIRFFETNVSYKIREINNAT